jgi:hypothetical protein
MVQNLLEKLTSPQLDQNYLPFLTLGIHNSPSLVPVQNRINKIHTLNHTSLLSVSILFSD